VRALDGELVRRGDERQPGQGADLGGHGSIEARRRVDPGADRGAAERQAVEAGKGRLQPLDIVRQHARIARPFLAERERSCVLHVGAADLDDVPPPLCLGGDRFMQRRDSGHDPLLGPDRRGDRHRRWERVVGGLRHVDVIVGMDRGLAAERLAGELA